MCAILEIKSLDFGSWALLSTFVQLTSSLVFKSPMWSPIWRPKWPPKWSQLQKISYNSREMSQNKTKDVTNWKYDNWDLVPGYCWSTFENKLLCCFSNIQGDVQNGQQNMQNSQKFTNIMYVSPKTPHNCDNHLFE